VDYVLANVYIDGFNLYYGCLRRTPYKWLDLGKLCETLLTDNEIHRIRYFTARIEARPDDPDAPNRQDAYLRALRSVPNLTIHYGHFPGLNNEHATRESPAATCQPTRARPQDGGEGL
jgi:hypothetical protein